MIDIEKHVNNLVRCDCKKDAPAEECELYVVRNASCDNCVCNGVYNKTG